LLQVVVAVVVRSEVVLVDAVVVDMVISLTKRGRARGVCAAFCTHAKKSE
jgi:hypothetical protein